MTRPYAEVIGDPIAHSKSPLIHNFWLGKLGIDAEYRACHVRPDELEDYFTRRRGDAEWRGCSVTIPHKVSVTDFVDARSREDCRLGAVNTIRTGREGRLLSSNTDVAGVRAALEGVELSGITASVLGSGGAARAAIYALAQAHVAKINVVARNVATASELIGRFGVRGEALPWGTPPRGRLLVNASPLGMTGQPPLALPISELDRGATVFDMVYQPLQTPLLQQSAVLGLSIRDGLQMLVGQAAVAFEKFFGHPAPRQHDAELRALLTA